MKDMNAILGGLHAERRARQGLPVPPVEAPAPVEPPAPVVEAPAQDVAPDEPPPAPADADDGSVRDPDAVVVEQLVDDAELVAVPPLMQDRFCTAAFIMWRLAGEGRRAVGGASRESVRQAARIVPRAAIGHVPRRFDGPHRRPIAVRQV